MGFTRYWNRTDEPITAGFVSFVKEVVDDCEKRGITICGGDGSGKPYIETDAICINGNGEKNLEHETFYIGPATGFNFCKTARKPYDYAVKTILDEAQSCGLVRDVSSDGGCFFKTDAEFNLYRR